MLCVGHIKELKIRKYRMMRETVVGRQNEGCCMSDALVGMQQVYFFMVLNHMSLIRNAAIGPGFQVRNDVGSLLYTSIKAE